MIMMNIYVFAEDDAEQRMEAQIFFDGVGENQNIQGVYYTGNPTYQTFGNVRTQAFAQGEPGYFAYININDKLFSTEIATPVAVTVRYMDIGKGYFSLRYATTSATFVEPEKVELQNSGEWKEYTFYLDDCCFRNANNAADLVLATWTNKYGASSEPLYAQWLKVEKTFPKKPVVVSVISDKIGNIFDDEDEKILIPRFQNISDVTLAVSLEYEIKDPNGHILSSGKKIVGEVPGGGTIEAEAVDVGEIAKKFGCYNISVKTIAEGIINGEQKRFESEKSDFNFSVANLLDEEEANPLTKMNTHWSYFNSFYIPEYDIPLMVQAGVSGVRDAIPWANIETTAGQFNSDKHDTWLNLAKKYGLDVQLQFCFSNSLYFSGTGHQLPDPENKTQVDAFKRYVDFLTKKYAEQIYYWEFWNEPNLTLFNAEGRSGAEYAKIAKEIYPIVKKNDPTSSFGVFSTSQIPMEFIGSAVDEGILEYSDSATVHPYDWSMRGKGADYYFRNSFYRERMIDFRNYLAEKGKPDMEVLVDEFGISTTSNMQWGSKITQAAVLLQQLLLTEGEGLADAIYFYEWATDGTMPDDQESNWGFIESSQGAVPFAARPAYLMLSNHNKYLTGAESIDKIIKDDASVYRFQCKNGEQIIALWDEKDVETFALDLGVNKVQTMDMYGNITGELISDTGIFDVQATFEPYYIIGDFTKFLDATPYITLEDGRQYAATNDFATFVITDKRKRDLEIKTSSVSDLEVTEVIKTEEGKWKVTVHTSTDAYKDNEIVIELYEGSDRVYYTKCHVIITEPFGVKAEVIPQSENNSTRFLAEVKVTNKTNSAELTGVVSADFAEIGGGTEARTFQNVKPGETVSVTLNLPEQIVKRTLSAKGEVKLDYGYAVPVDLNLSSINAGYAEEEANMTGPIDYAWWNGSDWFAADDDYAAKYYSGWGGKADSSFIATTKWNEQDFYMILIAKDDTFFQERSAHYMWQGDGVQLDIAQVREDGIISDEFTEFGVAKTPEGMQVYRYNSQTMYNQGETSLTPNVLITEAEATLEQINGEYVYRIRIPWTEVFGSGVLVNAGDIYGFSVILNDNDGEGRYWMEYTSGIGSQKNTALFGKMTLIRK